MFRDLDRAYTVLMDQLQDAYDEDQRLKDLGHVNRWICHEAVAVQDRIQMLIDQLNDILQTRRYS